MNGYTDEASVSRAAPLPGGLARHRAVAWRLQRWGGMLGAVICAVQIAFAALGFWVGSAHPGDEAAGRAAFAPHAMTGEVLQYLAVALLILGLVARVGVRSWLVPLVLAVLLFVLQGMLVGLGFAVSPWFGALHAFDGTVITAGFVWLGFGRPPSRAITTR